jgi:hypothetical protein
MTMQSVCRNPIERWFSPKAAVWFMTVSNHFFGFVDFSSWFMWTTLNISFCCGSAVTKKLVDIEVNFELRMCCGKQSVHHRQLLPFFAADDCFVPLRLLIYAELFDHTQTFWSRASRFHVDYNFDHNRSADLF